MSIVLRNLSSKANKMNLDKQSRILEKLLESGEQKMLEKSSESVKITNVGSPLESSDVTPTKRMNAFSKIYMTRLKEIMCFSKCSSQLQNLQINMTGVKISKSLQKVNIYYFMQENNFKEEEVASVLRQVAEELKYDIGTHGISQKCPEISFVRDFSAIKKAELKKIFDSLHEKENCTSPNDNDINEDFMITMSYNIFGLNYNKIMDRIKDAVEVEKEKNMRGDKPNLPFDANKVQLIPFCKSTFAKFHKKQMSLYNKLNY